MKRSAVAVALCVAAMGGAAGIAHAYWASSTLQGPAAAAAATVAQGAVPSVATVSGGSVLVNWGASTLSTGAAVSGYVVRRYDSTSAVLQTIGSGCAGTVAALSCTETAVPTGMWRYTVTPVFGTNWRGVESTKSGAAAIGAASLTLDKSVFGPPLPTTTTGTLTGFSPGESLSYTVAGTATTGSPTLVDSSGNATITALAIPTSADGPHTVRVTGATSGRVAAASILIDTTPPVLTTTVSPAPNAAGWNNTAVEITGASSDGSGSGMAYSRGTGDGSDPRTSPTAQTWTGEPVPIPVSTVIKYYSVDLAGNASAVQTLNVKIDQDLPIFTAGLITLSGGAYFTAGSSTVPGVVYYRGLAAGSFEFLIHPIDDGGSPTATLGGSALQDVDTGFFWTPVITTPNADGTITSGPVSWAAGTTSNPLGTLTVTDAAGNARVVPGTIYNDSTAPAGGSVSATGLGGAGGQYSSSTSIHLSLNPGTDAQSGLAPGARLVRATAPLSSSDGVSAGTCGTYGGYSQVTSDDPAATVTDVVPADNACYRYAYTVPDHVGNVATFTSGDVKVETGAPSSLTPSGVTITPVSGSLPQQVAGSTVYYRASGAGSFTVAATSSDARSGATSMTFPVLDGFTGGGTVAATAGSTSFRTTYAWSGNGSSASPGSQDLTATNNAGSAATLRSGFAIVADNAGPTGGSVALTGLGGIGGAYSTSTTIALTLAAGTDSGAGIATGRQLLRASASLTSDGASNGICGTFGSYGQVGALDPASPKSDVVPADHICYRYQYVVPDNVGNLTTYTSSDVKVDAVAPAPTLTFSNLVNASATGSTVFYRPAATSGSFTVTAGSPDLASGTAGYTFPTLPSGWTSVSGGSGVRTYSWSAANPTAPTGSQTVTAANNAGGSSSANFTASASTDATAPSGGSVGYLSGYNTNAGVNVSFTPGTDSGSGLAAASGLVQRSGATLSGGSCGTFGAFATVATNPTSVYVDPVTTGCFQYRYLISDNVGNQAIYVNANVIKIDQLPPSNTITVTNVTGGVYSGFGGAVLYYKGDAPGSFTYVDAVADAESGPASADFPSLATTGWTHAAQTVTTPSGGPFVSSAYSWIANPGTPPLSTITGHDVAGKIWGAAVTFTNDTAAPTSGSVGYPNGVVNTAPIPVGLNNGTDNLSGVDTSNLLLKRDVATLNTTTETCGSFSGNFATTVTLVGGADTTASSGHCYQYRFTVTDRVGNATTYTNTNVVKLDTSGPQVTAISSFQANSTAGNGKLEVGDRLVLTFNQSLASGSVPGTFTGATETSPGFLQNVTLNVPGITQGAVSTGSLLYVPISSTATFSGIVALSNNGTNTTVTLAVTAVTGATPVASTGTLAFTPAASLQDGGGNPAGGTFSTSFVFKLF